MTRGKWLVGAAAIAACAVFSMGTLRAVDVSVFPISGGIGQEIDLRSYDFTPVKKPRVRLVPHPDQSATKSVWAEVDAFDAERIAVTVTKGAAGVYDVVVVPKDHGVEDVTLAQPFTILVPAPESAEPAFGPAGTEVTIHGVMFGPSKGKVTIGGRKSKVTSWSDDTIVVVVPKKAPVGDQPLVVINKAGASTAEFTFSVAESAPGGGGGGSSDLYFRADLSGKGQFDLTNPDATALTVIWDQISGQLMLNATTNPAEGLPALGLSVSGLVPERPFPFVVGLEPSPPDLALAFLQYAEGGAAPSSYVAAFGTPGAALTVTIASWDGTFLTGTFSGTLVDPQGTLLPITVTNGKFRVRIVPGG